MTKKLKIYALSACETLLKPIVRLLLRNGITYREFVDMAKRIFVEVAGQDFGIRGRPTNISRVAIMTGLDRKEVKRIRDLLDEGVAPADTGVPPDRMTRILSAWHQDPDFLSAEGKPRRLPAEGDSPTLTELLQRHGGDVPKTALIKELKGAGLMRETGDGYWQVLKRYYIPAASDPEAIARAGNVIGDLATTLHHNLYGDGSPPRFERRAINHRIPADAIPAFHAFLSEEGQRFLESVDCWLSQHELNDQAAQYSERCETLSLGAGVYWIQTPDTQSGGKP